MRKSLLIIFLLIVLAAVHYSILKKEETLSKGKTVLLKLAPRDPRSLIQGDYMMLRYAMASVNFNRKLESKGRLVIAVDSNCVANFVRIDDGAPLTSNEVFLVYRNRGGMRLGAESFLFQEGDAALYSSAQYGELKVDAGGRSILTGLRDGELKPLGRKK